MDQFSHVRIVKLGNNSSTIRMNNQFFNRRDDLFNKSLANLRNLLFRIILSNSFQVTDCGLSDCDDNFIGHVYFRPKRAFAASRLISRLLSKSLNPSTTPRMNAFSSSALSKSSRDCMTATPRPRLVNKTGRWDSLVRLTIFPGFIFISDRGTISSENFTLIFTPPCSPLIAPVHRSVNGTTWRTVASPLPVPAKSTRLGKCEKINVPSIPPHPELTIVRSGFFARFQVAQQILLVDGAGDFLVQKFVSFPRPGQCPINI